LDIVDSLLAVSSIPPICILSQHMGGTIMRLYAVGVQAPMACCFQNNILYFQYVTMLAWRLCPGPHTT